MSTNFAKQKEWRVQGDSGFKSLKFYADASIPVVGNNDVLVKCEFRTARAPIEKSRTNKSSVHAASLNFRDLLISEGTYPFLIKDSVVPASDGAGEVVAVGSHVTRFQLGDKVATLFNQAHIAGAVDEQIITTSLGCAIDGTLRHYGTFNEQGLVHIPKNLSWLEAATLSCAALTA
jgi:D-arabinose 1-dehydrogenase-like Zn-dependent alcohol dehydrogenase